MAKNETKVERDIALRQAALNFSSSCGIKPSNGLYTSRGTKSVEELIKDAELIFKYLTKEDDE